ncbi:exodeoxyribonuclease VII small subunit [Ectothiorhodospira haloalkaliphila]|uniref:Exodeoxyribonuclease 7 small subunit n=1 Tax=Ectothiorhodospira haloalkaliphila TaxID=421628 RepID=W8KRZ4_9GAMM|nr:MULTISPECIES: exodeoxyribonuclease VII small subunit [Ectothiorhodospira]AHK78346.1 exodeoxyribonuclease VII small subunit [Ectothiorhodospira haloalkaliphila]MCG5495816.1 exodeoxyribonuclease VII small subunit [Ectothiorhodospira variabilis]MCG5498713.1 exodeoxyribonuclease VII small subunit [Ectothiorhodospira variabilis]MCG5504750.1 exodeoxyribonuclease VII small subunit [Ectothiorhodospira variabilis]MCG5507907.1 exodeoxyribonuclease VII small subunit [Ectothiorhodospira variabilis]
MTTSDTPDNPAEFEKDLESLEALVGRMEQGELSLEASLKEFERGIALTRRCQKALTEAEQKVRRLTEDGTEIDLDMPEPAGPDGED